MTRIANGVLQPEPQIDPEPEATPNHKLASKMVPTILDEPGPVSMVDTGWLKNLARCYQEIEQKARRLEEEALEYQRTAI